MGQTNIALFARESITALLAEHDTLALQNDDKTFHARQELS
jgi:hypothetical protein